MSLEQIINEDFYKNLFRLLHSPKPEASAELKRITDELNAMYEARGITEYWPSIPGDPTPTGEGPSDFIPNSTRKFEKPIAPVRKDSLVADRLSPHLSALRSNSPRLSSTTAEPPASKPQKIEIADDQQRSESNDSSSADGSEDNSTPSIQISSSTSSGQSSSSGQSTERKRKLSTDSDQALSGDADQTAKKRESDRRSKSDESVPSNAIDEEPVEKKPKLSLGPVQVKAPLKSESNSAGDELDGLTCVVCKTFAMLSAGNLMVECHGCHNMYHQQCHEPNVTSSQFNDPRLLWYCHQCEKKNQKRPDSLALAGKAQQSPSTSGRRNTAAAVVRDEKKPSTEDKQNAFKRSSTMETKEKDKVIQPPKPPTHADLMNKAASFLQKHQKKVVPTPPQKTSGSSSNTNPFAMALSSAANSAGLAKLVTTATTGGLSKLAGTVQQQTASASRQLSNTTALTTTTSSSASGSSNAKLLPTSSSQIQAAEKRLQMIKKKAAQKGNYKI